MIETVRPVCVFDYAASGQGLLNYLNFEALTEEEVLAIGLSIEEIRMRSFLKILEGRQMERARLNDEVGQG